MYKMYILSEKNISIDIHILMMQTGSLLPGRKKIMKIKNYSSNIIAFFIYSIFHSIFMILFPTGSELPV